VIASARCTEGAVDGSGEPADEPELPASRRTQAGARIPRFLIYSHLSAVEPLSSHWRGEPIR
jgi:hypothetical protein